MDVSYSCSLHIQQNQCFLCIVDILDLKYLTDVDWWKIKDLLLLMKIWDSVYIYVTGFPYESRFWPSLKKVGHPWLILSHLLEILKKEPWLFEHNKIYLKLVLYLSLVTACAREVSQMEWCKESMQQHFVTPLKVMLLSLSCSPTINWKIDQWQFWYTETKF